MEAGDGRREAFVLSIARKTREEEEEKEEEKKKGLELQWGKGRRRSAREPGVL